MTSKSQEVPDSPEAFSPPVHPHQLEIQEFTNYGLIIDARPLAAFENDHLPGAVCLPAAWSNTGVALHTGAGSALLAAEATPALPYGLTAVLDQLPADATVLVYDDRGGLDSQFWAERLEARGWHVDVLPGGWPNYRRWVTAGLELLPRTLTLKHWSAPPLGGSAQVLKVLASQGEQVLDLGPLAHPERLIWGEWRRTARTQEAFETLLVDQLRQVDTEVPLHVAGTCELGGLVLPAALRDALASADEVPIAASADARAEAWLGELRVRGWSVPDFLRELGQLGLGINEEMLQSALTQSMAGMPVHALFGVLPSGVRRSEGRPGEASAAHAGQQRLLLNSLSQEAVLQALISWQQA